MKEKALAAIISAALLPSCGGGGNSTEMIRGKVIDGYIRGATVFWDCNGDQTLNSDEISTVTEKGGQFTIARSNKPLCELIADVPWDAVDEDSPNQTVGIGYKMRGIPGKDELISPYTTLVSGHLKTGSATSVDQGVAIVAKDLGITGDILNDYKSVLNPENALIGHNAKAIVEVLKEVPINSDFKVEFNLAYEKIKSNFMTPGFKETLSNGVQPFIYAENTVLNILRSLNLTPNRSNIVVRSSLHATESDNTYLDGIAMALSQQHAADYGTINFQVMDESVLRVWMQEFVRREIGGNDPKVQEAINKFRIERQALLNAASAKYNATVADETDFFTLFKNDPEESINFVFDISNMVLSSAIDVASIRTAGVAGKINDSARFLFKKKRTAARVKSALERLEKGVGVAECSKDVGFLAANLETLAPAKAAQTISGCFSLALGMVSDMKKLMKYGSISKAIKAGDALQVFTVDVIVDGTDEAKVLALINVASDFFEAFKEIASLVDDPSSATLLSAIDLVNQLAKLYSAGFSLSNAAGKVQDANLAKATALYDQEVRKIFRSYYAAYLSAFSGYFRIVDSSKDAYVSSVSGMALSSGAVSVSLRGNNLPPTSLLATLDGGICAESGTPTDTERSYQCMPNRSALSYVFSLGDASDLIAGTPRNITVAKYVPVCALPQILQGGVCVAPPLFIDDFNGTTLDSSKWTSSPCLSAGDPTFAGNGQVHFGSCQSASTQGKATFSGKKIVIEARFAGQKGAGRDSGITLLNTTTGDFFQFGDTDYLNRGVYAYLYYGGTYEFVQQYGGTTTAFKDYRVTIEGTSVTIQRGDSLSNLTETYTATLPRSATDGTYYLRIGTGTDWYAPADFDWIRVNTY